MKQSNPNYLSISRLDYKNPTGNAFTILPAVDSFDKVEDLNEIKSVSFGKFYSSEEFEAFRMLFPKSYKATMLSGFDYTESGDVDFNSPFWCVFFSFNTFWTNKTTGKINESAAKRRNKVIANIKSIMK